MVHMLGKKKKKRESVLMLVPVFTAGVLFYSSQKASAAISFSQLGVRQLKAMLMAPLTLYPQKGSYHLV